MQLRERIIQRLKEVIDPETLVDVISMGLIKNLHVTEDGNVSLEFQPSSPVCPLALPLALDIQNALKSLREIEDLSVTVRDHQMADELNRYLKEDRE
jgi:metal-sulfur cluster biosynthetic enzyme